jgi:NADPH-dependent 2,4-dienoyl-CoA reductase/sulfur reductase-like enzyme/rhodanese-related sulfurtransferase
VILLKLVVIGAVAGGTSAAAKARRNSEDLEIVVYEKDVDISYSGCGMPYFIGDDVKDGGLLTPRDPEYFNKKYNIDIKTAHEVLAIDTVKKALTVKNLETGLIFVDTYNLLIFATGASSFIPPIKGHDLNHVFSLRNIRNMYKIKNFVNQNHPKSVVIIGTGFIGLELAENLHHLGLDVTMIEKLPQVSPSLDADMAIYVQKELSKHGVKVHINKGITSIENSFVILDDATEIPTDMVIISTGVKPNIALAKQTGIHLGITGAISVNERMETNIKDIYACGDCIQVYHQVTKKPVYRPLGSTANKTGRIAGDNASGGFATFKGIIGTSIYKIFDLAVAQTGLTEKEALNEGFDIITSFNIKPHKPEYLGGKEIIIKTVAEKSSGKILGAQIIGKDGVDKRIDIFATAITFGATAENLMDLDLAYAPPFATTKDPVMYSGMIIHNALFRGRKILSAEQVLEIIESNRSYTIIDTRIPKQYAEGHVPSAINIPHEKLREELHHLDKNVTTITYCNKGVTGNATQNILLNAGFKDVYSISGGYRTFTTYLEVTKKEGIK